MLCIVRHLIKSLSELVALGFPGSSASEESTGKCRRPWFNSQVRKIPWRRDRLPTPACLENPHGHRSLAGYSPWGHKESATTE